MDFDEELRALRAAFPARHFALELRNALDLAIAHAWLRAAPLARAARQAVRCED